MDEKTKLLGEGRMVPLVLRMALPLVLSMAFQAVYNIADSLFISRYSEVAFAGVSLVQPLILVSQALASGLGTGTSSLLSKCLGEENREGERKAVGTGWFLSFVLTVLFLLVFLFFSSSFVSFFTTDHVAYRAAVDYLRVFAFALPAVYISVLSSFLLQSRGLSRESMFVLVSGSVTNILLDPLFVFLLDYGAPGAALASAVGFWVSTFLGLWLLGRNQILRVPVVFDRNSFLRIAAVGLPAFLSQGAGCITGIVINRLVVSYGIECMVVYGMYLKTESFLFLAVGGISSALVVIAAYNYGAGRMDRVRSSFWCSLLLGWPTMLLGFLFLQLRPEWILFLFTKDPYLVEEGILCFRLVSCCLLFTSPSLILQGLLQGLGKGRWSLILSCVRFFLFLLPLSFVLGHCFGIRGVYLSYFAADVPTLALVILLYKRTSKNYGFPDQKSALLG